MARWLVILHRDGSGRRMEADHRPASVPELARVLRRARTARGLDLPGVSHQTGIPIEQLQDLESGTVDRLPDRVAILKALSRYAAFLHLPADQFVMTLVENWPNAAAGAPPVVVVHNGPGQPAATGVAPAGPAGAAGQTDDVATRVIQRSVQPSPGRPTSVGVPVVDGRHNTTAPVPVVIADTGVTPAVRRQPADGLLMVFVRSLAAVAALLLALGVAWLVINRVHPQWLADLHIPYTSQGARGATSTLTNPPTTAKGAAKLPVSTTPTTAAASRRATMRFLSADGTQASFAVTAPLFAVRISAEGGDTWVSASGPLSNQPAFEGILQSGQSQVVSADHQLTVQIGSTAARVAVLVNSKIVGTYVPPGAPFTMTFTTP